MGGKEAVQVMRKGTASHLKINDIPTKEKGGKDR
jgi:hypothetical protein